jgi:hypothetical protein
VANAPYHITQKIEAMQANTPCHFATQPNWRFNADANTGHGFAIFMASVGALQSLRSLRRRLTWALGGIYQTLMQTTRSHE